MEVYWVTTVLVYLPGVARNRSTSTAQVMSIGQKKYPIEPLDVDRLDLQNPPCGMDGAILIVFKLHATPKVPSTMRRSIV